jgi:hypothetical protein
MRPGRLHPARLSVAGALALLLALVVLGCGPRFDGAIYQGDGVAFRVGPQPPSWRRLDVSRPALAFRDEVNDVTVGVGARCGADAEDVPLAALTQHLFLTFTERNVIRQEVVPFDAREAMHTVLEARLDGVPKMFDVWVLKKDGCVYDLYAIARPSSYPQSAAAFERFVRGFSTVPAHD